ncbi:bifunctional methylenetetrahydrofolate dehydrogenase/cyclohydrolase 2, mitochondrial isoform X9 [Vulpes vulpes]|uniref:Bifunctional methylenetetrahydrofolate dehydrogenase/cyclohydrolase 2, mitochondrial isoform X9 n=1 Tax=Vulpes vulpes TaxID=9627 RepID=A0ABM4ZQQ9_VULVU|nr:probable bifunctional methylenetetrahydrofolate dehydrogenase/cyclohydrolase 2 isoform X14 [Vulpes lagopus]
MAVPARGVSLVGGRLSRAPALGGGPALPLGASRGLRSSGVRTSREKRFHLPEVATVCLLTCPHPQSSF